MSGAGVGSFTVPLTKLASLPRTERLADFHCVSGWSAIGLRWEGVPFEAFYRTIVEPSLSPQTEITHIVFEGLDGYRCVVAIEDVLAEDVLLAERLDGAPLDGDHGAPLRLLSPSQYGFVSVKHLCRVELHTEEPRENYGYATEIARVLMLRPLFDRHPRSRVWMEERNRTLPPGVIRPFYRLIVAPIRYLSARGSRNGRSGHA